MRVVICALAKNEELYINDWIKHHIKIGFDHIYLYDNNDLDKPSICESIKEELKNKVTVIDIRGIHEDKLQHKIYTEFYEEYNGSFNWCLFCDIDEFLFGISNIKFLLGLNLHKHSKQIRIKWKLFGDDDLIERNMSKPVYQVFKQEIKKSLMRDLKTKGNLQNQGKMMVRGGLKNIIIQSPHFASVVKRDYILPSVLPSGVPCYSKVEIKENYSHECIYLHHYMTKSLSEFINQKLNRTDAVFGNLSLKLDYYWRINAKTQEKLDYLKEKGLL